MVRKISSPTETNHASAPTYLTSFKDLISIIVKKSFNLLCNLARTPFPPKPLNSSIKMLFPKKIESNHHQMQKINDLDLNFKNAVLKLKKKL